MQRQNIDIWNWLTCQNLYILMLNLNSLVSKIRKIEWSWRLMKTCFEIVWAAILTFVKTLSAFSFFLYLYIFSIFIADSLSLVLSLFSPQSLFELSTPLAMPLSSLLSSLMQLELVRISILPSLIHTYSNMTIFSSIALLNDLCSLIFFQKTFIKQPLRSQMIESLTNRSYDRELELFCDYKQMEL